MDRFRIFEIYFLAFLSVSTTQASVIKFEAYPSILKANITHSASMRCSLADNGTGGQIGKRSVTNTTDDVLHISAIHITRNNGEDVASVTPFDAPIAEADLNNLEVKGDVSGTSSQGYLELTWKDPSAMVMGEYICEINTITHRHHSVVFTTALEMAEVGPTINDVINELKKQAAEITNLNQQKTVLEQQQTAFTQKQTELEQKQTAFEQQQTTLKQCVSRRVGFTAVMSNFNGKKIIYKNQNVVFDKVIYSVGGGYDQTTGKFTCSEAGVYSFSIHAVGQSSNDVGLRLKWNNNVITSVFSYAGGNHAGSMSVILHLKRNDVIHVMTDTQYTSVFYQSSNMFQSNVFVGHMVQSDCMI